MSKELNSIQSDLCKGIKGITTTINLAGIRLTNSQCPLLKTQLEELNELATTLSVLISQVKIDLT